MTFLKTLFGFGLLFSLPIYAVETNFGEMLELAEDGHQIVQELETPSDNYHLTTEEADIVKAYGDYQNTVSEIVNTDTVVNTNPSGQSKPDCVNGELAKVQSDKNEIKEKIKKRKYVVGVMVSINTGEELADAVEQATGYRSYRSEILNAASFAGQGGMYTNYTNVIAQYLRYRSAEKKKEYNNATELEKANILHAYLEKSFGMSISKDLILREHMIYATMENPENWKANMESLKDTLTSTEQKMSFLSDLGGRFLTRYNDPKAANGESGKTSVVEMFQSLADGTDGGVCRDVVNAQIEIGKALGVDPKNFFHTAYTAAQGRHDTFIMIDPDDPSKLHKMNYYEYASDDEKTGETQLQQSQSMPEVGIDYVVSDHTGKPVLQMPTELGKMVREASGYTKRTKDISKTYNIAKMYAETKYGTGVVFAGTTSNDVKVTGVGFNNTKNEGFQYGVNYYKTDAENDVMEYTTQNVYAFMDMKAKYNLYNSKNVSLTTDVGFGMEINLTKVDGTYKDDGDEVGSGETLLSTMNHVTPAIEGRYTSDSGDTSVYARVEAENFVHFKNEVEADGQGIHNNSITYKTGISTKVTENLKAYTDVAIITQTVGDYYIVSSGVEDEKRRYTVDITHQAPIGTIASFAPGATEVSEASFAKDFTSSDGTGGKIYIKYTEDENAGGRVGLNGEWIF